MEQPTSDEDWRRQITSHLSDYLTGIYQRFREDDVFVWAGAVAFKALITVVPLVILASGVLGLIVRQEQSFNAVIGLVERFLPAYNSTLAAQQIRQLAEAGSTFTIIGALTLLGTVTRLFATLRIVIANVFKRESRSRSFLDKILFDLRMSAQISVMFILSIGITVLIRGIQSTGLTVLGTIPVDLSLLERLWLNAIEGVLWTLPVVITIGMFLQLYYYTPIPRPTFRSATLGAIVAGLLWEIAKIGFAFFASTLPMFSRYDGSSSPLGSLFSLLIALLIWVYYSGIVMIIGAEVAALYEERHYQVPRQEANGGIISAG